MIYRTEDITHNKFSDDLYSHAYLSMSDSRKKKADGLRRQQDKLLCVFSDYLLREMLQEQGIDNPVFFTDEKGKPYLEGNSLYFSISHSGSFIACAIDTKPVGIDIEMYRDISPALLNRVCTQEESDFILQHSDNINNSPALKRFFSVWTAKEAYLKCTGTGLSGGLKNISVASNGNLKEALTPNHRLTHILTDNYALSVVESI